MTIDLTLPGMMVPGLVLVRFAYVLARSTEPIPVGELIRRCLVLCAVAYAMALCWAAIASGGLFYEPTAFRRNFSFVAGSLAGVLSLFVICAAIWFVFVARASGRYWRPLYVAFACLLVPAFPAVFVIGWMMGCIELGGGSCT
ncbi:hypothetical protein [Piscinibacterium candidicorallinum]|uniref:Yip1 domain-containing protein n=1 Tax=Piscinibacterium candidicorallinum TaxID=1793872 RepID=A0ABV7H2T8_9BURK